MKIILAIALLILIAKANPFEDTQVVEQEANVSEILPHGTPFLNGQSELVDIPSIMDRTGSELKNGGKECWNAGCNHHQGKCNWCGADGMCCRRGWIGNECDGQFGGFGHHLCVLKPSGGVDNNKNVKCEANKLDEKQYCRCAPGQRISEFKSKHNNRDEDRIWELKCEGVPKQGAIQFNGYANLHQTAYSSFDHLSYWNGLATNSFLVGMESHHSNRNEDRIFRYFYQNSKNWVLSKCSWEDTNDNYDNDVDYVLQTDQVIAGVWSKHHNVHEDRIFRICVCTLSPKCTELVSMKYDYDHAVMSSQTVMAGETTKDNLDHPESGTITTTISRSQQISLSQSFSFQKTTGNEIGFSLERSMSAKVELDGFGGVESKLTVGFTKKWTTLETWSRSNTKEITEANGFQITFTDKCPGNSKCVQQVTMEFGKAKIPYEMIASNKKNDVKCVEKGYLYVQNPWKASSSVTTTTLDPSHCQDSIKYASNCPGWTWACSSTTYAAFMQSNCKETCGLCQPIPATTPTTPTGNECADVTCKFTVDNVVNSVKYNDNALQISGGAVDIWEKEKVVSFQSCDDSCPGILEIAGTDYNNKDNCIWGGLLLGCTASRSSSPWHNFVSDNAHWKLENGATPCQNDKGFIPVGSNIPFISALNSLGAKKIWNNNKIAIMRGSPVIPACGGGDECAYVTCKFTVDNAVNSVKYNDNALQITGGAVDIWEQGKVISFQSCSDSSPGILEIKGTDYNDKDNCIWGGLLLGCTASRSSSPWHNFVSDNAHWKMENGATPCQNDKGFISVGSKIPFISALNSLGAKKIWNDKKIATMRGSPGF